MIETEYRALRVRAAQSRAEAVRLLEEANHVGHTDPARAAGMVAAAQVHATLAQTDILELKS